MDRMNKRSLGQSDLQVPRLGVGAMTWGDAKGFARFLPRYSRKAMGAIQPVIHLLREIGERYSKTPSQAALRWLVENPSVLSIPGAKNGKQALDNAGALTLSLTAEEVELLSQATLAWRV